MVERKLKMNTAGENIQVILYQIKALKLQSLHLVGRAKKYYVHNQPHTLNIFKGQLLNINFLKRW